MSSKREQIIQSASELFELQGYHATSLSQILKASQAPKGSLYYYFPDGKEQLAEEAVLLSGQMLAQRVQTGLEQKQDLAQAFTHLLEGIANQIEQSNFRAGGPLTAIAMETATSNPRLNQACRAAFQTIRQPIEDKLRASGIGENEIGARATTIIAAIEGGTLLSRTQHSGDPLRQVAQQIQAILQIT